jgi:hypothetical protein
MGIDLGEILIVLIMVMLVPGVLWTVSKGRNRPHDHNAGR